MAILGKGAKFYHGATPTLIGEVSSISISRSRSDIDTTKLSSTGKEFAPGLGEATVDVSFQAEVSAGLNALRDTMDTCALQEFKVELYDCSNTLLKDYEFEGFLTSWNTTGIEVDGVVKIDASIRISGAITETDND